MATENERDMNDFAGGFGDERAALPGDDKAFEVAEDAPAGGGEGGMDLDAAAAADGVKPEGEGGPAAIVVAVEGDGAAPGADTGTGADKTAIVRQSEGGSPGTDDAADNGAGGNATGTGEGDAGGVTVAVVGGEGGDSPITETDPAAPNGAADDEPTNEKDIQRKKSWEGRLKAEENRLKALAAELEAKGSGAGKEPGEATGDALEAVAEQTNDPSLIEAAEDMSQRVEAGEISPEDAMTQLKEDFGEPFVKLIESVATAAASKALDGMRKDVDALRGDTEGVIEHLKNSANRMHFEALAREFPDFNEINKSPEFEQFLDAMPPEEKADAERVRAGGDTGEVIALLKKYKAAEGGASNEPAGGMQEPGAAEPAAAAAVPPTVGPSEDEIDNAAGVRGGGMQLPSEPTGEDDFAAGWDDTPDVKGARG